MKIFHDAHLLKNIQFILLILMTIFGFLLVALLLIYPEAVSCEDETDDETTKKDAKK